MKRWVAAGLGVAMAAVAIGFCVSTLRREHARVADALGEARPALLAVAVVAAASAMGVLAVGWHRCLAALGASAPLRRVAGWYFAGELGKYVPGGIWPVVGRGELARRGGVPRPVAYQSVVWSLACWYGSAVLPLAAAGGHPAVQRRAGRLLARASGGRMALTLLPFPVLLRLLVSYLPAWVLIGATTAAVAGAYGEPVGGRAPVVAVLAWVAGFLAVPVPAGAGVREAVFVAASGLPDGLGLTVAVTCRLVFVAVDAVGAGVAAMAARR